MFLQVFGIDNKLDRRKDRKVKWSTLSNAVDILYAVVERAALVRIEGVVFNDVIKGTSKSDNRLKSTCLSF